MKKIICVEDDADIRELLQYALTSYGFSVTACESAAEFYSSFGSDYDLVLLDIMLPDEDGISILKKIRANNKKLPIILLTAKSNQMDKIKGLDSGADDYITKPFDVMELISRIKALLRRTNAESDDIISFHSLLIKLPSREVSCSGKKISLTYKEFELLKLLTTNLNTVLTRDVLMDKVWDTDFEGESRTIDVHIRTLRQKIGENGKYIETVRNVGYKAV